MLDYLSFQLAQISPDNRPLPTIILGAVWGVLTTHFGSFPASNPVFWVSIFWVWLPPYPPISCTTAIGA